MLTAIFAAALTLQGPIQPGEEPYRSDWKPFVIPSLALPETAGAPLDLSWLSPEPAGKNGFLRARGEELVDGRGNVVRLFGTNLCDFHPMPPKELAPRIAKRLQELGVNFIRLHYYDWAPAPDGLMKPDMKTVDPGKLDQMHWLIHQLNRCGIYVDLNLHVARKLADNPEGVFWMSKGTSRVLEDQIQDQMSFARQVLGSRNPYDGNRLLSENPGIALVELSNENTFLSSGTFGAFSTFSELPKARQAGVVARWNAFLKRRHRTYEALNRAWNPPTAALGEDRLRNGSLTKGLDEWTREANVGGESTLRLETEGGQPYLRWTVTRKGGADWSHQLHQMDLSVKKGDEVVLTFRARSPQSLRLNVSAMNQGAPWAVVGSGTTLALRPEFQTFRVAWKIADPGSVPVRLSFNTWNTEGTVDLADLSLRPGTTGTPVSREAFAKGEIPAGNATFGTQAWADWTQFAIDLDLDFGRRMKAFLRRELGVKSLVLDTQINYGGASGFLRAVTNDDLGDIHSYPAHPSQLGDAQGGGWAVAQKSMLDRGVLGFLGEALWRPEGKPFACTEWDVNPPNDAASESYPLMAVVASLQNWNALAEYSWLNFQPGRENPNGLHSWFATTGHTGQVAMMPWSALTYRLGLIPARTSRKTLVLSEARLREGTFSWEALPNEWREVGVGPAQALVDRLSVRMAAGADRPRLEGDSTPIATAESNVGRADTLVEMQRSVPGKEVLLVRAPQARLAMGRTGGRSLDLGDVRVEVGSVFRDYANIALVSLDGLAIAQSKKVLLTVMARAENRDQKFSADRTTVGPSFGLGPALLEPVPLTLSLPGSGWRATALDPFGRRSGELKVVGSTLRLSGSEGTCWVLLER